MYNVHVKLCVNLQPSSNLGSGKYAHSYSPIRIRLSHEGTIFLTKTIRLKKGPLVIIPSGSNFPYTLT